MIIDKKDVNKLISVLEAEYPKGVPQDKIDEVKRIIENTNKSKRILPGHWKKVGIDVNALWNYSQRQKRKYPHMKYELYDSNVEFYFAYCLHCAGLEWKPRHKVGRYRLDFAFIKEKLDVEVDGVLCHGLPEQQRRDEFRDKFLNSKGWIVYRIPAYEAQHNSDQHIRKIRFILDKKVFETKKENGIDETLRKVLTDTSLKYTKSLNSRA